MIAGLGSGDPFAFLAGALKIVSVIGKYIEEESEHDREIARQEKAYDRLTSSIEAANKQIERQLKLLAELSGEDWVSGTVEQMTTLDDKMADILASMKEIDVDVMFRNPFSGWFENRDVDTTEWDIEKFIALIERDPSQAISMWNDPFSELATFFTASYFELTDAQRSSLEDLLAQYEEFEDARRELLVALQEELTGTTIDSLVDQITSGFEEGKKSVEDFTSTFEDLMRAAIINSFKRDFLDAQLRTFYEQFYAASENGMTEGDIEDLKETYDEIIAAALEGFEDLQLALGISIKDGTADAIADAIANGFLSGKTSVDDFADYVNQLLKDAVMDVFRQQILGAQISAISASITTALEDQVLTSDERTDITSQVQDVVEANRDLWESLTGALDFDWGTPEPLSGAIERTITEETGTELAGLMRKIADDNRFNRDYNQQSVDHLVGIEANTYNTVEELKLAVTELKLISDNTKPVYTGDL